MQEINVTFKGLVYTCDTGMEEETVLKVALRVTTIREFYLLPAILLHTRSLLIEPMKRIAMV